MKYNTSREMYRFLNPPLHQRVRTSLFGVTTREAEPDIEDRKIVQEQQQRYTPPFRIKGKVKNTLQNLAGLAVGATIGGSFIYDIISTYYAGGSDLDKTIVGCVFITSCSAMISAISINAIKDHRD